MWTCKCCGYSRRGKEPGFLIMGSGWVRCPQCNALHYVLDGGVLILYQLKDGKEEMVDD